MNINVQHLLIKKLQSTNNKLLDAVQTFDENLSSSNTTQDVSSEVFDNVINLVEKQDHLMQYIEQDGGTKGTKVTKNIPPSLDDIKAYPPLSTEAGNQGTSQALGASQPLGATLNKAVTAIENKAKDVKKILEANDKTIRNKVKENEKLTLQIEKLTLQIKNLQRQLSLKDKDKNDLTKSMKGLQGLKDEQANLQTQIKVLQINNTELLKQKEALESTANQTITRLNQVSEMMDGFLKKTL